MRSSEKPTGSRPCPGKATIFSCAFTARSSLGSIRPGCPAILSWWSNERVLFVVNREGGTVVSVGSFTNWFRLGPSGSSVSHLEGIAFTQLGTYRER
jgi:hypothetical protein